MDFILFFQIVEKVEDLTKNNNKIYPVSDRKLPIKIHYRPCYISELIIIKNTECTCHNSTLFRKNTLEILATTKIFCNIFARISFAVNRIYLLFYFCSTTQPNTTNTQMS